MLKFQKKLTSSFLVFAPTRKRDAGRWHLHLSSCLLPADSLISRICAMSSKPPSSLPNFCRPDNLTWVWPLHHSQKNGDVIMNIHVAPTPSFSYRPHTHLLSRSDGRWTPDRILARLKPPFPYGRQTGQRRGAKCCARNTTRGAQNAARGTKSKQQLRKKKQTANAVQEEYLKQDAATDVP